MMFGMLAIFALFLSGPALAADEPDKTADFVSKAAVANKFEIDTSQLALKYGQAADVKAFAKQMISDHEKIGQEFKAALKEANIQPPSDSLDVAHTAKYAKLRLFTTEKGFDSAYTNTQLQAHEDAVALFKDYAANAPTPAVKSFAEKTLPMLEGHLKMVQDLRAKVPKS
jgi:putative membrane protein